MSPDTIETQESISAWSVATFGPSDPNSPVKCLRLLSEVIELCMAAGAHVEEIEDTFDREIAKWTEKHGQLGVHYERFPEHDEVPGEMADCYIVLAGAAGARGIDLQAEVNSKMHTNRHLRTWAKHGDGTGQHV